MSKSLIRQLKSDFSFISRCASSRGGECAAWLSDNYHIIEESYRDCLGNRRALREKAAYSEVASAMEALEAPTPEALCEKLSGSSVEFGLRELRGLRAYAAVFAVAQIKKALSPGGSAADIPRQIKTLFAFSHFESGKAVESLWRPESLLALHEPEYAAFDDATKDEYRTRLARRARKTGKSEYSAAFEIANGEKSFGEALFTRGKKAAISWILLAAASFLPSAVSAVILFGAAGILLFVPLGAAAIYSADFGISLFVRPFRAPRMDYRTVPDNAKTLVAVASLIGSDGDKKLFERLERFSYMFRDKNVFFCLLADFPDSENRCNAQDSSAEKFARAEIDRLNSRCGNRFFLFLRERVLNESEGTFGGWERKRGAVCELVSHLCGESASGALYGGRLPGDVKYLLTLDSDTNPSPDSIYELVSIAEHPLNRPRRGKNRVVGGYGIIQPAMRTELKSAFGTAFSRLTSGEPGADSYSAASFRRGQDVFGVGGFCGKGLINVRAFYEYACGVFPEGLVLSHDTLEGGILRTLSVSDISFSDSTPQNAVSYYRRQHRWIRGDVQNLAFLGAGFLPAHTKIRLVLSVLRHLCPVFAVLGAVFCFAPGLYGAAAVCSAFSYLIIPQLLYAWRYVLRGGSRAVFRYFSNTASTLARSFGSLIFELCSACRQAILALHAFILAVFRLFTREKTLEWTTAAQAEKLSSGLGKYVLDGAGSLAAGVAAAVFVPNPFARLLGMMWFVYPLAAAALSRALGGGLAVSPVITPRGKDILKAHARDMWRFYSDTVSQSTSFLPPDNIQLAPSAYTAMRTSPTNIGFYLLSAVAANDFGFITESELYSRLGETLSTIEALPKRGGLLYNWYDLTNLSATGGSFVSSVDCGNFVVMLSVLKQALAARGGEESESLCKRCEKLINGSDLSVFYDSSRGLFFIGVDGDGNPTSGSHYDMLMSEMRLTSYYCAANGVAPKKHWIALGRAVSARRGYFGMLSWSGTMFEYLMPLLFMPLYRDSFIYESVLYAVSRQRAENRVWGVSESAYYMLDSEMHYQYKANGIQSLALRRISSDENVVSPYSVYLAALVCPGAALKNLRALAEYGMYGKYGMYEALDFNSGDPLAVKSYMAHHVGMSLIAAANVCFENVFVKRFLSDKRLDAYSELLQEPVPASPRVREPAATSLPRAEKTRAARAGIGNSPDPAHPRAAMLSHGDVCAVISDAGHVMLRFGDRAATHTQPREPDGRFTPCVLFQRGDSAHTCTTIPDRGDSAGKFGFERGTGYISHIVAGQRFSGRVKYGVSRRGDAFIIETRAEAVKKYDVALAFEPVLETEKRFLSHIAFSRLFIESEFDREEGILYFFRRGGENGGVTAAMAVAARDKRAKIKFLSDSGRLPALCGGNTAFTALRAADGKAGSCVSPFCLFKQCGCDGGRAVFIVACGETKEECFRAVRLARCDFRLAQCPPCSPSAEKLLSALLYGGAPKKAECVPAPQNLLWAHGISGDLPVITVVASRPDKRFEDLARSFIELARANIRFDMVFVLDEGDKYSRPAEAALRGAIARAGAAGYIRARGGLFLLRREETDPRLFTALCALSHAVFDMDSGISLPPPGLPPRRRAQTECKNALPPRGGERIGQGAFIAEGYEVDKSKPACAPYSFILAGRALSAIVTQNGLGATWLGNAREKRLCSFYGDRATNDSGETLFLRFEGNDYDVCACASGVTYRPGYAEYRGEAGGNRFALTVTVCEKYPLKLFRLRLDSSAEAALRVRPSLGSRPEPAAGVCISYSRRGGNAVCDFRRAVSGSFGDIYAFAGACGGRPASDFAGVAAEGADMLFFIGACPGAVGAQSVSALPDRAFFERELAKSRAFAASFVPPLRINSFGALNDRLIDLYAPYQTAACRFFARGAFYQSGGAFGFRDQLQDCLLLVDSMPDAVRTHIIRCCAHQYSQGDVMHWWHHSPECDRGIRTKCSDDMLFLPLVVAIYFEKTADPEIFKVKTPYRESAPLAQNERERYETPPLCGASESVYSHCLKALRRAATRGARGLVLMGSCDWNDAFSAAGEKGKGESVFSTMLYVFTAGKFAAICREFGDDAAEKELFDNAARYRAAIERHAFFGDRYARAFCDDGTVLGARDGAGECEIDILTQAWAAIIGLDGARVKTALDTAFARLYDGTHGVFKLFDPPFSNEKSGRVGYIRGYSAGMRENGGQYTHGAIWGALGFICAGMTDRALKILSCADPAKHCAGGDDYRAEPYAVAADVYAGEHTGRGGWTWYTGASAWYYVAAVSGVLGIKQKNAFGEVLVRPKIPFEADISLRGSVLHVRAGAGDRVLLDGKPAAMPVKLLPGEHTLFVPLE